MSDEGTPALYGYASRFSVAPGETITFHVSGRRCTYQAQLVELQAPDTTARIRGLLEQEHASDVNGQYTASFFKVHGRLVRRGGRSGSAVAAGPRSCVSV